MKKFIILIGLILSLSSTAYAGECFEFPVKTMDYYAETTQAVYLKDIACMDGSTNIVTLSANEVVHVIADDDGWKKLERADGTMGWVYKTFLRDTSRTFEPEQVEVREPMFDVDGHKYEKAIRFIYEKGIVSGYEDGSYKPNNVLNRAELLKIVVEGVYDNEFKAYSGTNCFSDVPADAWFTPYVCFAKAEGMIEGYGDGTFRPSNTITVVETTKIAMEVFGYEYPEDALWYKGLMKEASDMNFLPLDFYSVSQDMSRALMADMITRILKSESSDLEEYLEDEYARRVILLEEFGLFELRMNYMQTEPESGDTVATISTNMGDIKLFLYTDEAPETAKNFVEHANAGNYDDVIFHRVVDDFMIQTGDFENQSGTGGYSYLGPGTSLKDEFGAGLSHIKGAVSMANSGPDSGGSQFFIVQMDAGTDWLDGKHAIFGFVYEGMDVVDEIAAVETDFSKPLEDIIMESVEISTF